MARAGRTAALSLTAAVAGGAAVVAGCVSAGRAPALDLVPPPDLVDSETTPRRIAARIRVLGLVTDRDGEPVEGARAFVRAHTRRSCIGGRASEGESVTRTDGWFVKTLYFYSLPRFPSCVVVRVDPPAGSGLAADSIGNLMSEFRHGGGIDTVLVQLTLGR